ncbi:MAG: YciI family protein [Vicinamibacterales bacterium]
MKFMMHMNVPGGPYQMTDWSPDDIKAMVAFMGRFNKELSAAGKLVTAEGLVGPDQARLVRAGDDGKPVVTDGPFAETKEFIAGFWIVEVADENEAYALAAKVSMCPGPGGKPLHMPLEVRAAGGPPPTD